MAGVLSSRVDPARIGVEDRIRKLMRRLGPSAVHLDTALLFSAFRDAATATRATWCWCVPGPPTGA